MKTFNYLVTTQHDNGDAEFQVVATNMENAKKIVMAAENCPDRSIIKIKRIPKSRLEYDIQGLYGGQWESVTCEDSLIDAKTRLKEYRDNEKGTPFRIKKVRIPNILKLD